MKILVDEHNCISFYNNDVNVGIFLSREELKELFDKLADEYDFETHRPAWYYQ